MITIGDRIKLNEEQCPKNKRLQMDFQFGKLGYFVAMLEWELTVISEFDHSYNGKMIVCKVTNNEEVKCDVVFRLEDVVRLGSTKFKIDYEVIGSVKKNQAEIERLTAFENKLETFREFEKMAGKKISDLRENYTTLTKTRASLKTEMSKTETIAKVKTKQGVYTLDIDIADENKVVNKLRQLIRLDRQARKEIKTVTKTIAGNMKYDKVGGVLAKKGTFSLLNEKFAINIIKEHKKPTSSENCVGIEIEMLAPKDIDFMNKEFVKARLHRFVNVGTDGSIRTDMDGVKAMELRILIPESQLATKLKEICEVLRKNDCYANRSCGMHVHLDMRNRNPELCYKNLFKLQDLMLATQPVGRRNNSYCKPNTAEKLTLKQFETEDRYKVINTASFTKHSTIEIRLHEGATKYKDIFSWVNFLVSTANQKEEIKQKVDSITKLESLGIIDAKTLMHLEERIQEYSA